MSLHETPERQLPLVYLKTKIMSSNKTFFKKVIVFHRREKCPESHIHFDQLIHRITERFIRHESVKGNIGARQ